MLGKMENYTFENKNDVVDYVAGGFFPPTKEEFDKLMVELAEPEIGGGDLSKVIPDDDKTLFINVMNRVHKNRVKTRNNVLLGFLMGTLGLIFLRRK